VTLLVLSRREVEMLLDLDRLVEAVGSALAELSSGRASMPPRITAEVAEPAGLLAAMPAHLPSTGALTVKLVSVFPGNLELPTHQAVICCFDAATGQPVALMDGAYITAARTAAGSALATRLLARPDSRVVAILGSGVQARAHARALDRLPNVEEVRLAGRDPAKVEALAAELGPVLRAPIVAVAGCQDAVRAADVVCATTHAADPVLSRHWLRPGTHVNSVGYNTAGSGEVDSATIRDAVLAVESRAAALARPPAGAVELWRAVEAGALEPDRVIEIGELVAGRATGRTTPADITVYKSVGVAVQDAAAAALVLQAAREQAIGALVDL
jgi:alanine dehydrogenase